MLRPVATLLILVTWLAACIGAAADDQPKPDTHSKTVVIELLLVDLAPGQLSPEMSAEQLQGIINQHKDLTTSRIRLTTLDGSPADVQIGERTAVQVGRTFGRGGPGIPGNEVANYQMDNHGLLVQVIPAIQNDGSIRLELKIERSRLESPKASPKALPADSAPPPAAPFVPPKTSQFQTKSVLRLTSGKPVLAASHQPSGGDAFATFVLVTATAR